MSDTRPNPEVGLLEATQTWVRQIMDRTGDDPTSLARRARLSQSTLSRLLGGEVSKPSPKTLEALAQVTPVGVPPSIQQALDRRGTSGSVPEVSQISASFEPLPIWGVIPYGRDGEFYLNPIALHTLRRPATWGGSALRVAGFFAPDETMAPRWQMGEPVVFDLARPGTRGEFALIRLSPEYDPNGDEGYLFRRYDGRSDGKLQLSTASGPPGEIEIPLSRVLEVRRVLNWQDLVG